jgi:serine/threonine protein kinase
VAVKFLHPEYSRDAGVVSRFFSEAQAAARMQHPNMVDVYDLDQTDDGSAFMVLEFLEGESLGGRLKREGRFDRLAFTRPAVTKKPRHPSGSSRTTTPCRSNGSADRLT